MIYFILIILISLTIGKIIEKGDDIYYKLKYLFYRIYSCPEDMNKLEEKYGKPLLYVTLSTSRKSCIIEFNDYIYICGNIYPLGQLKNINIDGYNKENGIFKETTEIVFVFHKQNVVINTLRTLLSQYDLYVILKILNKYNLRKMIEENHKKDAIYEIEKKKKEDEEKKKQEEKRRKKEAELQERKSRPIISISRTE